MHEERGSLVKKSVKSDDTVGDVMDEDEKAKHDKM